MMTDDRKDKKKKKNSGNTTRNHNGSANIAVIGAGWWSQGWHLPQLHRNPDANLVAIVDVNPHPQSNLNPNLKSLESLQQELYPAAQIFDSVDALWKELGEELDGVIVATPHATHYSVARELMQLQQQQSQSSDNNKALHILMEKPMTTNLTQALELYKLLVQQQQAIRATNPSQFWINHSANYRVQTRIARQAIVSGRLGPRIRHITAFFASPLKWIFDDPANTGWNEPSSGMLGNGFAWGQSSHLLAFVYHICGPNLQPIDVYCAMTHSQTTGADVSHSATIRCCLIDNDEDENNCRDDNDVVVLNVSGTSLLPGNAHSDPPVPKKVQVEVFGDDGSLHYSGNDRDPDSGRLELRKLDGSTEVLHDKFHFENLDTDGLGPESLQNFVQLCCGKNGSSSSSENTPGANALDGLRSIQTIDAMYKSHASHQPVRVEPYK